MRQVTLIPGDGIGPEVTRSAREILTAAGAAVEWDVAEAGMLVGESVGPPLPANVFESAASTRRMTAAIVEKL